MRKTLLISGVLLSLLASFKGASPKTFSVSIYQSAMLKSGNMKVIVNNDSIVATGTNYKDNEDFGFGNTLSSAQAGKITEALTNIDLAQLQENYTDNNAPDDLPEFDFTVTKDDATKKIHVYETRVDGLLQLVKTVNTILPKDMQLEYDENYLKRAK